jgi:hypothetical protein
MWPTAILLAFETKHLKPYALCVSSKIEQLKQGVLLFDLFIRFELSDHNYIFKLYE